MTQTGPVSYCVEVASGGKWRRHADQIRSSNIQIQHDTDVQFNKPIVKPVILSHCSSVPNVEPHASPTSSGNSVLPPVPLEPRYSFRPWKLPKHSDMTVCVVNSE